MEQEPNYTDRYLAGLVHRHADMIMRIAYTYLKSTADAQDICQEVFLKAVKHRKTFENAEHEKSWIIRVAVNCCKDALRSPWRRLFSPLGDAMPPIADKQKQEVVSLVMELPKKYRIILYLYYFEGYATAEIAELLQRKDATVRTQLKRAREMLKANLIGGLANE